MEELQSTALDILNNRNMNIECPNCQNEVEVKNPQTAGRPNFGVSMPKYHCDKCSEDFGAYIKKKYAPKKRIW